MIILKLLIVSLLISQIFASQGAFIECNSIGCSVPISCPPPPTATPALHWVNGQSSASCAINDCPASGATISGAIDLYCNSCPGTPNGSVQAVFANTSGNACVAATATCGSKRAANTWTDADCLACNGNTSQYAKADKSGCQATPIGAIVTCQGSACSPSSCAILPTATPALSWVPGQVTAQCAINACPASGATISGATDLYCKSCPGTPNGNVKAVFANTSGNACVAATATCGSNRAANSWTDADCLICNNNTSQYANADKSGCQATPIGAIVTCQGSGCSPSSCATLPTTTPALSWVPGQATGQCAINACPASGATISGATDLYCLSCPGTANGSVQAVFANASGNACVASTRTCGASRTANTWTNADCLACNGNANQYAKSDKSGCQSTAPPPSSQSYSNSMIILSSVLFLITLLF